jgi:hypothetical protein
LIKTTEKKHDCAHSVMGSERLEDLDQALKMEEHLMKTLSEENSLLLRGGNGKSGSRKRKRGQLKDLHLFRSPASTAKHAAANPHFHPRIPNDQVVLWASTRKSIVAA